MRISDWSSDVCSSDLLLEWTMPTADMDGLGLADYADRLIGAAIDAIEAETGRPGMAVAGHSLGGTRAAIFASLNPDRVRGLVLVDAPLSFGEAEIGRAHV